MIVLLKLYWKIIVKFVSYMMAIGTPMLIAWGRPQ